MAGAFSTTGASHLILRLSELTLIEGLISVQIKTEAERNLRYKLPTALSRFQVLVQHALTLVDDPSAQAVNQFVGQAHPEDAAILTAAILNGCQYLVTFNGRHYHPASEIPLAIITPGKLIQQIRKVLSQLR